MDNLEQCGDCGATRNLLPIVGIWGCNGILCEDCYRDTIAEAQSAYADDTASVNS